MTRDALAEASTLLRDAAEAATGDHRGQLYEQADQLARLADADRGPDHGRLARHEHVLTDVASEAGDDVTAKVEAALDAVRDYRSTVEGV
jgi:hypothetical protein